MDEYYPTDCEYEIITEQKERIKELLLKGGQPFDLIELGAGDGMKTEQLLAYLFNEGVDFKYLPNDISSNILKKVQKDMNNKYPSIIVEPLHDEYFNALEKLGEKSTNKKVVLFLGGNIGNFSDDESLNFLRTLKNKLQKDDILLIGFDLKKDPGLIMDAYNDPHDITKQFNLNLLKRINKELGGDIDLNNFYHHITYDPVTGEMK
ncbi:MAG: L-histidine N(alpha)-methyltransferase, partial [Flavobacteriales bacterium]